MQVNYNKNFSTEEKILKCKRCESDNFIIALTNVSVTIPNTVKRGDKAMLICNYDLHRIDLLYSVKWYIKNYEFYRYTPKENPAIKIFAGRINDVDKTQSNASHVFLNTPVSGKFTCEVSEDAPDFDTSMASAEMQVVDLPTQRPIITGIHSRYRLGDIINGNCSSDYSKPAANLTWWINDIKVPFNYIRTYDLQTYFEDNLQSSIVEINFIVTLQHFVKGRLKLKCSARVFDIYAQESEKLIEEDRPRILASGRSPDMNVYPFDQPTDADGFNEQNELYLTHYKNAPSCAPALHKTFSNHNSIRKRSLISPLLYCIMYLSTFTVTAIKMMPLIFSSFPSVEYYSGTTQRHETIREIKSKINENRTKINKLIVNSR